VRKNVLNERWEKTEREKTKGEIDENHGRESGKLTNAHGKGKFQGERVREVVGKTDAGWGSIDVRVVMYTALA